MRGFCRSVASGLGRSDVSHLHENYFAAGIRGQFSLRNIVRQIISVVHMANQWHQLEIMSRCLSWPGRVEDKSIQIGARTEGTPAHMRPQYAK